MSKRGHNSIQSLLPEGYRQLEYIQSTGTQYVNSNFLPNIDTRVVCDGLLVPQSRTGSGVDTTSYLFGTRYYSAAAYNQCVIGDGGTGDPFYASFANKSVSLGKVLYNERHVFSIDKDYFKVDGTIRTNINVSSFASSYPTYPIFLFAMADNYAKPNPPMPSGISQPGTRIYLFEVHIREELIRCLVPVLRLSNNKPGLYDLCGSICPLTGTPFYINAGSGEFLYN